MIGIAPQGEYGPGTVHVVFGNAAGFGAALDLATLDGTDGFSITSSNPLEIAGLGTTVGSARDVNGDGYDDIVVGAPRGIAEEDPFAGVSYVIFGRRTRLPWADLLRNVFAIDVLQCPRCPGRMTVIAVVTDPGPVQAILAHLGLPTQAPLLAPGTCTAAARPAR